MPTETVAMSHRERLVRTLCCHPTDRPPLPFWMGFAPWGETLQRWRSESGIADLDIARYFGFDPYFETAPLEYGPCPRFEPIVLKEDADWVWSIDYRGITMRNRRDLGSMPEWVGHPVQSPDDWARYKAERLGGALDDRLQELDFWAEDVKSRDMAVQVGLFPWGVFGTTRDLMGAEEVLIGFYTEPDLILDIMSTYVDLWLALYERVADVVRIDHLHIWEDMSGKQGSLISMDMVERFMMPQYDRLVAFARSHGIPVVSVDTDGIVDELVPTMIGHGINAYMPFEVQAGNDIVAYRREYLQLGIFGGLDKRALCGSQEDTHRELDRAETMLALGGWVPGFDHLIPPDVPWKSFEQFVFELKRMVGI